MENTFSDEIIQFYHKIILIDKILTTKCLMKWGVLNN